jgi:transposase-like protein
MSSRRQSWRIVKLLRRELVWSLPELLQRDVEELLAERELDISHETIRDVVGLAKALGGRSDVNKTHDRRDQRSKLIARERR